MPPATSPLATPIAAPLPSPTGPTTPFGLPVVQGVDPIQQYANYAKFSRTWSTRWPRYTSMGFSVDDLTPALRYDAAHLNTTGSLLPESHVMAIAMAAHTGKPYAPPKKPNLIQAIRSDAGNLLRSIPNLPAELLVKEPARINAILGGRWDPTIEGQDWFKDLKDMIAHPFFTAPTADYKAEEASLRAVYGQNWAAHIPGLRLIPGESTAASLFLGGAQGRSELAAHPLSTLLDVAPYLGEVAGPIARMAVPESLSGIAKFGVDPALRDIGVRPATIGEATRGLLETPLRNLPMGGFSRQTRDLSKVVNTAQQQMTRAWRLDTSSVMDTLASHLPEAQRSLFLKDPVFREEISRQVEGTDPTTVQHLVRAFRDPTYTIPNPPPHIAAMQETMRDLARRAERIGVEEGRLVRIEGVDPSIDGLVYNASSPAAKSYLNYLSRDPTTLGPEELASAKQSVVDAAGRVAPAPYAPAVNAVARSLAGLRTSANEMLIGGDQAFSDLLNEVNQSWSQMRQAGFDPPWIHQAASPGRRPFITPGRELDPEFTRSRTLGVNGSYIPDLQVAVSDTVRQMLEAETSKRVVSHIGTSFARPLSEVLDAYGEQFPLDPAHPSSQAQVALERRIARNWVRFEPDQIFGGRIFRSRGVDAETMVIPRSVDSALKAMVPRAGGRLFAWEPALKGVWIGSILSLSPAYLMHNLLGSATLLMAETGPGVLRYLDRAWEMARHEETLPEFSLGHMGLDLAGGDEAIAYWTGKSYGRLYHQVQDAMATVGRPARSIVGFSERLYKSMAYLYGEDKAIAGGLDHEAAREAGVRMADKVLHDFNSMTPIEKNIIAKVFPFWGWMKTLWGYTLRYPFDHPVRIAIANNITRVTTEGRDPRLADLWDNLFQIGAPSGGPFGRVKVLDLSSINPFATAANMWTWAGLMSHFNPALQEALSIAGWTPANQQELFPAYDYDPTTGRLVVKQPGLGDRVAGMLGVFPQLDAAATALKLTPRARAQALSDPVGWRQAWEQRLFNLPFKTTPQGLETKDLGVTIAGSEQARLTVADRDITSAVRDNNLHLLQGYLGKATQSDLDYLRRLYYGPLLTGGKTPSGLDMLTIMKAAGRQ